MSLIKKGGISLSTLVFLVFLVLKLANVINWSWWLVTLPIWIGLAFEFLWLGIVLLVIFFVISLL